MWEKIKFTELHKHSINLLIKHLPIKLVQKESIKTIAKRLITYWMQAEMWGQTRSSIAKTRCLQRKTQYKVVLPGPPTDIAKKPVPVFASGWKLLSLKKLQETKFSTDYIAPHSSQSYIC